MKYFIPIAAFCMLMSACDTAVSPTIAGAGDGGVIGGGGTGSGSGTTSETLKVLPSSIELSVGNRITLTTNSPGTAVSWKSSATSVVSVGSDGVATAVGVGVAVITATTQSGTVRSATSTITVRAP
jgi:uncharacterized protein YjdB